MEKLGKRIFLRITPKLEAWLEAKAAQGYNRSAFVRAVLEEKMEAEDIHSQNK